jgi:predicted nucleotidyltransferase
MNPEVPKRLDDLLRSIGRELPALVSFGVVRIGVFGSRVRGADRPDSDVDLLVELAPGRDLLDLVLVKQHLAERLGMTVDVTTPSGLRPEDRDRILGEVRPVVPPADDG